MKKSAILFLLSLLCAGTLEAAAEKKPEPATEYMYEARISQERLLSRDKQIVFTPADPCWLDRYRFFCCPVRKMIRRQQGPGKVTDYCYNARDELIGIREYDSRGAVKKSDFRAVGGCSICGSNKTVTRRWRHDTTPRMAPPKKKRK
ncbi:MAG: hypothetical protein IJT50_17535 [Lentisphaeria bacterium]|nr:hypothetical protein [Lentisphaeria bacterium]